MFEDLQLALEQPSGPPAPVILLAPCTVCGSPTMEQRDGWGFVHRRCEPRHTYATAPSTSQAAGARAAKGTGSLLAQEILRRLTVAPMTDDELSVALPEAHAGSLAKRRHDLLVAGLVVDSGQRRPTRRGVDAIAWRAVPSPKAASDV